ncbi:hypothetical protein GG496_001419 [Candidatus Fervidibacteria bacterium JGI MDM2 JNZ-1-D12]
MMRKEVPTWVAALIIIVVLVIVIGIYWHATSVRRAGEPSVTKPPATAIPSQAEQGQVPQKPAEAK